MFAFMSDETKEIADVREQIYEYMKARRIPQSIIYDSNTISVSQSHIRQILTVRSRPLLDPLRKQINEILGTSFGDPGTES